MIISQLSVFMENKSGRLAGVLEALAKENHRILALSVADTTDFGILRLLVSEPEKARTVLKNQLFSVNVTDVIAVMVPDQAKEYDGVLKSLSDLEISVEYTYTFSSGGKSIIILQCSDNKKAIGVLKSNGLELLCGEDLIRM